jgi:hypothetical protein
MSNLRIAFELLVLNTLLIMFWGISGTVFDYKIYVVVVSYSIFHTLMRKGIFTNVD